MSISVFTRASYQLLEIAPHRFSVGQFVRLTSRIGVWPKTDELYRITGTLPARDNSLQYRIRNDKERYERVAIEDNLELVAPPVEERAAPASRTEAEGAATPAKRARRNGPDGRKPKPAKPLAKVQRLKGAKAKTRVKAAPPRRKTRS